MGLDKPVVHTLGWSSHRLVIPCEDLGWEAACGLRLDVRIAQMGPRAGLVSTNHTHKKVWEPHCTQLPEKR